MRCNMCDARVKHVEFKNTHIYVCKACPNVQFEFYDKTNIEELQEYLLRPTDTKGTNT